LENLKILKSREVKEIRNKLKEQFGYSKDLNYVFLQNEKGKVFITNKDLSSIDFEKLKINTIGMYFVHLKEKELRLSIDGSQLIGRDCSKNVVELDGEKLKEWLRGEEVSLDIIDHGFFIVKNKDDFYGCGKLVNGRLLNYIPKARRVLHSELV
tara:strand:+ start:308 stop:769 length:462 start_codon:yes stop_codon:yes gene_type:complete